MKHPDWMPPVCGIIVLVAAGTLICLMPDQPGLAFGIAVFAGIAATVGSIALERFSIR